MAVKIFCKIVVNDGERNKKVACFGVMCSCVSCEALKIQGFGMSMLHAIEVQLCWSNVEKNFMLMTVNPAFVQSLSAQSTCGE